MRSAFRKFVYCDHKGTSLGAPVNYRILYFFSGKNIVVISHGISKEAEVPAVEIKRGN